MPDANFWETAAPQDDMPKGRPALEAEIRRLRSELLRVQDLLGEGLESKDWTRLKAAVRRARALAEVALAWRTRPPKG